MQKYIPYCRKHLEQPNCENCEFSVGQHDCRLRAKNSPYAGICRICFRPVEKTATAVIDVDQGLVWHHYCVKE